MRKILLSFIAMLLVAMACNLLLIPSYDLPQSVRAIVWEWTQVTKFIKMSRQR